jgi:Ca-activated chloride channel family protein
MSAGDNTSVNRTSRLAGLGMAAAVSLAAFAFPAAAQPSSQPRHTERTAPVMMVLDGSGSMAEADPSGGTRMAGAQRAMHTLIDDLEPSAEVGLQVYGANTTSDGAQKERSCRDIETVYPVGRLDKAAFHSAVDQVRPGGFTPIGNALRAAAAALPDDEKRAVVLISDGEDTCAPPDPCEVAAELAAQGIGLVVHTVGLAPDDATRRQLGCIAERTGGDFVDVTDAGELEDALPRIVERALRTYQAAGEPVDGTPSTDGAPELAPGQYVDTIEVDESKIYRIDVPENVTAYVAATQIIPAEQRDYRFSGAHLRGRLLDQAGTQCGGPAYTNTVNTWRGPLTTALSWANDGSRNACSDGDGEVRIFFEARRIPIIGQQDQTPHQLELVVVFEPRVTGDTGPPAEPDPVTDADPPTGDPRPLPAGDSFNNAVELPGSGVYSDLIQPGEWVAYRVRLDWGQSLAYRFDMGETRDFEGAPLFSIVAESYTQQRTPAGEHSPGLHYTGAPGSAGGVTSRVLYNNRGTEGALSTAGWVYVTLRAGTEAERQPIPYVLRISVAGDPIEGPEYAEIPGLGSAPATGTPTTTTRPDSEPVAQAETTTRPALPWILAGVGLIGVAGVVVGLLLARRQRNVPRS